MQDLLANWDEDYRLKRTPWELGHPSFELVRVVDEGVIAPCRAFELGCGTGADTVYLATRGFDVTAADCSAIALDGAPSSTH